jgi:hypothetical protein
LVDEVVKALLAWAEASRKLGVARKNYVGEDFASENKEVVEDAIRTHQAFDAAFLRFVDLLVAGG